MMKSKVELSEAVRSELIKLAGEAREHAYAPYSQYQVGAAVLTASGKRYTGCNVENAAYPTTMCAERVAIFKAVSEGDCEFLAVAVVTANGGSPCGSCRQVMAEFGSETVVMIADTEGRLRSQMTVAELLPGAFGPAHLGK
jgi:cytidine deaminase